MNELLNNYWFLSIAKPVAISAFLPIFTFIINSIRARFGRFSGTYIAITTTRNEQIIELVKCKHIKNKVKGKIYGVAFIQNEGEERKFVPNNNKYSFKGSVAERLLVISYNSVSKRDLSAGSLTLSGNTYGTRFSGIWGGLEEGGIVSSHCVWLKSDKKLDFKRDYDTIMSYVKMDSMSCIILSDNASGKSNMARLLNLTGDSLNRNLIP